VVTRISLLMVSIAALVGCNRLSHQTSVHVQLGDDTKTISDVADGLAGSLRLAAHKAEFDYGGPDGHQTAYELTGPSNVIFVQTESATYCDGQHDAEHPAFNDRLLVANVSASTSEGLAASMAALREVSATNGATVVSDEKHICRNG
jgi:hypothetical protein